MCNQNQQKRLLTNFSKIKDHMVVYENALDFKKKSLQRLLRAIEKTANSRDRRVSRETLRKLQTKNKKQEDSVSLGYPLQ